MYKRIPIEQLQPNTGQIKGLSRNPRKWSDEDLQDLADSLKETPELYDARPLLVIPFKAVFVVLGGNMRLEGSKLNGDKDCPCWVYDKDTPLDKLKEIVLKDNSSFGVWDTEAYAKEWSWAPKKWHVPNFGAVEAGEVERESRSNSRAAGGDDVSQEFQYAIKIEFETAEEQLKVFEEMQALGYKVTVV